jgi:hypothetical protein
MPTAVSLWATSAAVGRSSGLSSQQSSIKSAIACGIFLPMVGRYPYAICRASDVSVTPKDHLEPKWTVCYGICSGLTPHPPVKREHTKKLAWTVPSDMNLRRHVTLSAPQGPVRQLQRSCVAPSMPTSPCPKWQRENRIPLGDGYMYCHLQPGMDSEAEGWAAQHEHRLMWPQQVTRITAKVSHACKDVTCLLTGTDSIKNSNEQGTPLLHAHAGDQGLRR